MMTKTYAGFRRLTSEVHFYTAAMEKTLILAFQNGVLIGSGKIEEITEDTIKIRGEWYVRKNCVFAYAR